MCDDQSLHYTVLYVSEEQEYCYGDGVNEFPNPNEVGCTRLNYSFISERKLEIEKIRGFKKRQKNILKRM